MSAAEAPASLIVPALVRQVAAAGGFATVLAKGAAHGSALLLVSRHGGTVAAHERLPDTAGGTVWRMAAQGEEAVDRFVARQRAFDPDLWVVELDVADWERFVPGNRHAR